MKIALYKAGYRAEIRAREILKGWGFNVMRSAKSGGPFDLVGFNKKEVILVQVKLCPFGKIPQFSNLKRRLAEIPVPKNCRKELWVWERRKGFHYFPV